MRTTWVLISAAFMGCATVEAGPVASDPDESGPGLDTGTVGAGAAIPDVRCPGAPDAGKSGSFHHFKNVLISGLGDPRHRGFDLVASASTASQSLEGWLSYTVVDKALEDEDVDVFACRVGQWRKVGTARTDDEGHFTLGLSGTNRLPVGMRDLFVSVVGDRTGVRFLGYVAPDATQLVVSDVDGTLTSSENAFLETVALGGEPDARAGATKAFAAAITRGSQLVYVTARGNQFTTATRDWLDHKGFPRGPVRLSPSFLTLPGGDTIDYKTRTISALSAAGFELSAGVGNRASDVTAYTSTGVAAGRIFIELPEFVSEVQPLLDLHQAIGFAAYDELLGKL
jgi:phosphatidate phosphatase PAH1